MKCHLGSDQCVKFAVNLVDVEDAKGALDIDDEPGFMETKITMGSGCGHVANRPDIPNYYVRESEMSGPKLNFKAAGGKGILNGGEWLVQMLFDIGDGKRQEALGVS